MEESEHDTQWGHSEQEKDRKTIHCKLCCRLVPTTNSNTNITSFTTYATRMSNITESLWMRATEVQLSAQNKPQAQTYIFSIVLYD